MLQDIGVSHCSAQFEASKPFGCPDLPGVDTIHFTRAIRRASTAFSLILEGKKWLWKAPSGSIEPCPIVPTRRTCPIGTDGIDSQLVGYVMFSRSSIEALSGRLTLCGAKCPDQAEARQTYVCFDCSAR